MSYQKTLKLTAEGQLHRTFFEDFDPDNYPLKALQERYGCRLTYFVESGCPKSLSPLLLKIYHPIKYKVPFWKRIGGYMRSPNAKYAFRINDYLSKKKVDISPKTYAMTVLKKGYKTHSTYLFQEYIPNTQRFLPAYQACRQESEKKHLIKELAKTLAMLHQLRICHFDIGFDNIIVQKDRVYIIDYDDAILLPKAVGFLHGLCKIFDLNIILFACHKALTRQETMDFFHAYCDGLGWSKRKVKWMKRFINKKFLSNVSDNAKVSNE
ncbi:hypothetical protein DID77_00130 [Candidatus Marinamargulisbacteria bacterium SCGC AG-439-L15]|nr:hypothetical protein DID77_00130 [Candidatus Marinamargulisbacteria bacterium SCGC AG-439-L15]